MSCSWNSQRENLLQRPSSEKIPQDSAPEAPTVGNKPKKAAFRENGVTEKGKGMIPNEYKVECSPDKVGVWFRGEPET